MGSKPKMMTIATLTWNDRGFGFIKPESGGSNVFFYLSDLEDARFRGS
jgi:cold shock CspA family protein